MQNSYLKDISRLPKHSVASLSGLRRDRVPRFEYLHRIFLQPVPECLRASGIKPTEHYLPICSTHPDQRQSWEINSDTKKWNLKWRYCTARKWTKLWTPTTKIRGFVGIGGTGKRLSKNKLKANSAQIEAPAWRGGTWDLEPLILHRSNWSS